MDETNKLNKDISVEVPVGKPFEDLGNILAGVHTGILMGAMGKDLKVSTTASALVVTLFQILHASNPKITIEENTEKLKRFVDLIGRLIEEAGYPPSPWTK